MEHLMRWNLAAVALCLSMGLWMAGCGGDSGPTDPAGANGSLKIWLTDAPTDEICELHVYIRDMRVKPDGQPQLLLGSEIGDYDLLQLQGGPAALMGDFTVDQGRYQFIEILLDESQSFVFEKQDPSNPTSSCLTTQSPLQVPSEKIKVAGPPFEVDESTGITIDFDARKSLKRKGGGGGSDEGWQLKPVVSIESISP